MICTICSKDVVRIKTVERNKYRRFIYTDDVGGVWTNRACPSCHIPEYAGKPAYGELSDRVCRACKTRLPKTRYFTHENCSEEGAVYGGYMPEDFGCGVSDAIRGPGHGW